MSRSEAVAAAGRHLLPAAVLGLSGLAAQAQTVTLTAAPIAGHYHAVEHFANGRVADAESGRLHGSDWQLGLAAGPHSLSVDAMQLGGDVDYSGSNQFGLPVESRTDLRWRERSLAYRYTLPDSAAWRLGLDGALGWRRLARSIAPTFFSTPLTEVLTTRYASAGLQAAYQVLPRTWIDAGLSFERTLASRLDVDFHGAADAAQLRPGSREGHRFSLGVRYEAAGFCSLALVWREQRLRYGDSPAVNASRAGRSIGSMRYPGSQQALDSLALELALHW